jgi:hypothetical protein
MVVSAAVALAIICIRTFTLMGFWRALSGIIIPGAIIMAVTLSAAVWPQLQGILLTALALGFFVLAMMLMPKATENAGSLWGLTSPTAKLGGS